MEVFDSKSKELGYVAECGEVVEGQMKKEVDSHEENEA